MKERITSLSLSWHPRYPLKVGIVNSEEHVSHYALNTEAHKKYEASEKGKVARARYQNSPKGVAARKRYHARRNMRAKLLDEAMRMQIVPTQEQLDDAVTIALNEAARAKK